MTSTHFVPVSGYVDSNVSRRLHDLTYQLHRLHKMPSQEVFEEVISLGVTECLKKHSGLDMPFSFASGDAIPYELVTAAAAGRPQRSEDGPAAQPLPPATNRGGKVCEAIEQNSAGKQSTPFNSTHLELLP